MTEQTVSIFLDNSVYLISIIIELIGNLLTNRNLILFWIYKFRFRFEKEYISDWMKTFLNVLSESMFWDFRSRSSSNAIKNFPAFKLYVGSWTGGNFGHTDNLTWRPGSSGNSFSEASKCRLYFILLDSQMMILHVALKAEVSRTIEYRWDYRFGPMGHEASLKSCLHMNILKRKI